MVRAISAGSGNASVSQDVFAQVLNYYNGDYKNASVNFNAVSQPSAANAKNLYNGMITSQLSYTAYDQIGGIGANDPQYQSLLATTYSYDVLYRLKATKSASTRSIFFGGVEFMQFSNQFAEKLSYDANGNITNLERYKADGTTLRDKLTYYGHVPR